MAYNLPGNVTEPLEVMTSVSREVPILAPGILFMLWVIIAVSGYYSEERRLARGQFAYWAALGGLIVTTFSFILFIAKKGLIGLESIVIFMAITFGFGIWYFVVSKD